MAVVTAVVAAGHGLVPHHAALVIVPQWPKVLNSPLAEVDPELFDIIEKEKNRQFKVRHHGQNPDPREATHPVSPACMDAPLSEHGTLPRSPCTGPGADPVRELCVAVRYGGGRLGDDQQVL